MAISTTDLWLNFAAQIQQIAAPSFDPTVEVFSFAGVTLAADLGDANPNIINEVVYSIGDTMPAWSPSYTPGGSLSQAYNLFLSYVQLNGDLNPNLQSQINIAAGQVTAAQTNYNTVQQAAWTQWNTLTQEGLTTAPFTSWATVNYPTLQAASNALAAATENYSQLMTQAYGAGYQQLEAAQQASTSALNVQVPVPPYNMIVTTGSIAPAGSTNTLPGQNTPPPASAMQTAYSPNYSLAGFASVYSTWQSNSVHNINPYNFNISGNSSSQTWQDFGWSASAEAEGFFDWLWLGGSTSVSSSTQTYDASATSMNISVSFAGLGTFSVAPSTSWYNAALITAYGNQLVSGAPAFFGNGGILSLLPTQVVIGFCPTVVMTLDQSTYNSYKSQFNQTASVGGGFGPFFWGSGTESSYSNKSSIQFSDQDNSITIGPIQSTVPLLMGVISTVLKPAPSSLGMAGETAQKQDRAHAGKR